jgi:hypothetical protein
MQDFRDPQLQEIYLVRYDIPRGTFESTNKQNGLRVHCLPRVCAKRQIDLRETAVPAFHGGFKNYHASKISPDCPQLF